MAKRATTKAQDPQAATPGMVPVKQAAALLMITERWVRELQGKGYIPKGPERGAVSLVGAVQGYIRWLKDEERRASKSAAASEVQKARAEEIRLRTAVRTGQLAEWSQVEESLADILARLRGHLGGVPAASTRDLTTRAAIETHMNEAFTRARAEFEALGAELREQARGKR